ncbi:MAG: hypothetical protein M3N93_02505 [Acidobacteriota bacterium]|nr:hypothetical protein [Acidobacteriota bacterium]
MKIAGFFLLPAGWVLVLAAVAMLQPGTARVIFLAAGVTVELLGLAVFARAHLAGNLGVAGTAGKDKA